MYLCHNPTGSSDNFKMFSITILKKKKKDVPRAITQKECVSDGMAVVDGSVY